MQETIQKQLRELAETLKFFRLDGMARLISDISDGFLVRSITNHEDLEIWKNAR